MDTYTDSLQAKREAEAKKRTSGSARPNATAISFSGSSPVKAGGQQPGAVGGGSGRPVSSGPQPTGAFAPTGGGFVPSAPGPFAGSSFAPQSTFGAQPSGGAFAPSFGGGFQPSGTFGTFRPPAGGSFGAAAGPLSTPPAVALAPGGGEGVDKRKTQLLPGGGSGMGSGGGMGSSGIGTPPSASGSGLGLMGGSSYSPAETNLDPLESSGKDRHVTMGSAGQHQRQTATAAKLGEQMAAFGIAQMVLPADDNLNGGKTQMLDANGNAVSTGSRGGGGEVSNSENTQDVLSNIPRRGLFQCYVMRDKSSFKTMMNPKYALFATRSNKFLLSGRKRANKQTSNYLVSLDQEDLERSSNNFFGKVRSNVSGTEFIVYDKGCKVGEEKEGGPFIREELGAILYETNVGGMSGPRKIKVILPVMNEDGSSKKKWIPRTEDEGIIAEYRRNPDSNEFIVLTNKEPTWNEQLRSYQLNFHGRVTKPSVKNFQLCDVKQPTRVVFQFGKVDENKFNLDFQYPLTAYQALCLALTSFDNKLACK